MTCRSLSCTCHSLMRVGVAGAAVYNTLLDICVRTKDDERGYEVIDRM